MNKLLLKYILIYLSILFIAIAFLWIQKENKIKKYLQNNLKKVQQNYDVIYNDYKHIAHIIYHSQIETPEVINILKQVHMIDEPTKINMLRRQLYNQLKNTYKTLRAYNLKQLHFHLPNNDSFLRFHKINKYGDNLTHIRKGIAYVNKTLTLIDGFEIGKIYDGYRFIFPLFDETKTHLGSVEVSFSTGAMQKTYIENYKSFANFLIPKKLVDQKVFKTERNNYITSHLKGFVIENQVYENIKFFNPRNLHIDNRLHSQIIEKIDQKKPFNMYNKQFIINFLPVINVITQNVEGVFVVKEPNTIINHLKDSFIYISLLLIVLLGSTVYYFYQNIKSKHNLLNSNIMLKTIIKEADSGIGIIDSENGKFLDVNNMYCLLLGYSKEELLKLSCHDIIIEDYKGQSNEHLKKARVKEQLSHVKKLCRKKNGNKVHVEFSLKLLPNNKNFISVINSIENEIALEKLNKNLKLEVDQKIKEIIDKDLILAKQSKDAAMGEMIDAIAHQWKGPLGAIRLLGQSILFENKLNKDNSLNTTIKHALSIETQVEHLLETLDEFRSFFRQQNKVKNIKIETLLDSVKVLMKDELIKNDIKLEVFGKTHININVIPNEFKHVIINLYNNSKDAFLENKITPKLIQINVIENDTSIILKICDNAGGIDEKILNKIFRSNFTTKENSGGTGIGLYMTKQIVDKIGAKIEVENENIVYQEKEYQGACFSISFDK